MKTLAPFFALLVILFVTSGKGQETITEPSTDKIFPAQVTFSHDGREYTLGATGTSVRKKLMFKVYGMVHYMQDAPTKPAKAKDVFAAILTDGKAKQIIMDFARDVDAAKIKETYLESFQEHTSPEEFRTIQPLVNQFVGYFTQDVKENDQFRLRWVPGGTILSNIKGQENPPITSELFARVLWSIWLGEDSVVDRDDLVERVVKD